MVVRDVIQSADQLLGQEIDISGYLLSGKSTAIHESNDPASVSIALPHPKLQELLCNWVPVNMGSEFLYREPCRVTGTLQAYGQELLFHPSCLTVESEGEEIIVRVPETKNETGQ